ncbi:MAG: D-alanine--D-alanine ligase [Rhodospirillales bacterium]|nr:D-alanine--D-alanine ligase [Rhodospirillales bacterium]
MSKKVALLVGGWSAEREVSLNKGKKVETALREAGYDLRVIEVRKDLPDLISKLTPKPDVVFNNLHGRGGEDGIIQSVLEILEIPYTHSGVLASALAMNKPMTKRIAMTLGIQTPEGVVAHRTDILNSKALNPPYVVKPIAEGSSCGVTIIREHDNKPPFDSGWHYGDYALVERFIQGRELTCAILDGKAQSVTEIKSHTDFFDYEAKYNDTRTEYLLPAPIPQAVHDLILEWSERLYIALGCNGLARCDYVYDDRIDEPAHAVYLLEINTQPGLTPESIGPSQVIYNGMSFTDLCRHLVETASCHETQEAQDDLT